MKNRIISILLTACLLAGLLPAATVTAHATGDLPDAHGETGSNDRPYIINEASDFSWITSNKKYSGYFLQTADIDLTGITWIPIGDNVSQFCGQYNGNGYTIRNMSLNDGSLSYIGMFGYTSKATIENVTLDNVSFTGGQTVNQAVVGSIAGMASSGTVVQRCRVTGSITGATNDTIGGIVGSNGATVKFCSSAATITAGAFDSGSAPNTGGIVGSNWGGTIQNCSNTGSVSSGAGTNVGGIVGFCYSSGNTVSNCFSTGTVTGPADSSGAIIGKVDGGTAFTASSANYYLTGSAASGGTGTASAPGLTVSAATAENLKLQSTYAGWDFSTSAWLIQSGRNNGYPFLKGVATVAPTGAAASISAKSATLSGNVTAAGDGTVTERGIQYLKISGGTPTKTAASSAGLGTFSVSLTGLEPVTQYCAMAYAINEVGTAYGEPIYFSTTPKLAMTVSPGSVVGATKAVISDAVANHFVVNVTDTATGYVDAGNAAPTTGANLVSPYVSGNDITTGVAVGKYLQVYNVDSNGKIVNMNEIQLNTGHIKSADLTLPYTQSFENGGSLPADWNTQDVENTSGYSMWSCTTATTDGNNNPVTPVTGSYMAQADFYNCGSDGSLTTSRLGLAREIALPANGTYNLSLYMYHSTLNDTGLNDAIQPQVSTDGGITWNNLGPQLLRTSGSGWVQHTISLDAYAGNSVRIGFLGISDYGYSVFLDDINVVSLGPVISVTATGTTGSTYGSTDSRSFSIADSNFTTVPTAYTAEWCNADGTTANAPSAGTLSVGTVTDGDATLTLTPSATADAGTYSFKVSSGDTSAVTAFTISKADAASAMKTAAATVPSSGKTGATVTLPTLPAGASYGTPAASGAVTMTGMSISGTTLTFTAPASTAGQTGAITVPVSGAKNYNDYSITVTITSVAKTAVTITGLTAANGSYSGSAVAGYSGTPAGYAGTLNNTYYLADGTTKTTAANSGAASDGAAPVNAGAYRLTVSVPESDATYTGSASVDFSIAKAPVSFTVSGSTYGYDAAAHTASVAQAAGETPSAAGKFTVTYQKDAEAPASSETDAGEYKIIVTLTDDNLRFSGQADGVRSLTLADRLTIARAGITPVVSLSKTAWTYGEAAGTPSVAGNTGSGAVTCTYYKDAACTAQTAAADGAASNGAMPTAAGTYYVKAAVAQTANYEAAVSAAVAFTIAKAAITPAVTMAGYVYGATPGTPGVTGNPGGGAVTYYYSTDSTKVNKAWTGSTGTALDAGTYYMKASVAETTNYAAGDSAVIAFRVAKAAYAAPTAPTVSGYTVTVAEADRSKSLEYSLDNGTTWAAVPTLSSGAFTLTGLTESTPYTLSLRVRADSNHTASAAAAAGFTTPANYSVAYNANYGSGSVPAAVTQTAGSSVTVASGSGLTRTGYTFTGWNTKADGSGTTYAVGSSISSGATLYAKWTPNTYTVKFSANGGTGTMTEEDFTYDTAKALTANAFTRGGYHFAGWAASADGAALYSEKQSVKNLTGSGSVTLYAVWIQNVYSVSGTVKSDSDTNVTVKLMRGSAQIGETKTLTMSGATAPYTGTFSFTGIVPGTYNIVATQGNKTMTQAVVITNANQSGLTVTMPADDVSSVLTVDNDTPAVVVGNLDAEAETKAEAGKTVTIAMAIESTAEQELPSTATEAEKETQEAIDRVQTTAAGATLSYLNISVTMTVKTGVLTESEQKLTSTNNVVELVIPYDMTGKTDIKMYRYHDGAVQLFTKLDTKPADGSAADATYYLDTANSLIYAYAQKFSTYAIAYATPTAPVTPVTPGGASGGAVTSTYSVTAPAADNGSVKLGTSSAAGGTKVTVTVTPDSGYTLKSLTIRDAGGNTVSYTDNKNGTYTFTMPASAVTVSADFAKTAVFPFTDVPETHWARAGIAWAYENGIFTGTDAASFSPELSTSRGMIATVLWRIESKPAPASADSFGDVLSGRYYAQAVAWAAEKGVVKGYSASSYGPEDDITREQLAAILYRYAKYRGYDVSKGESTSLLAYTDAGSVSAYALPAMRWAVGTGLIEGSESKLLPGAHASRAQTAVLLQRFAQSLKK